MTDRIKIVVRVRPFSADEAADGVPSIVTMDGASTHVLDPTCFDASPPPDAAARAQLWTRSFHYDASLWSHGERRELLEV